MIDNIGCALVLSDKTDPCYAALARSFETRRGQPGLLENTTKGSSTGALPPLVITRVPRNPYSMSELRVRCDQGLRGVVIVYIHDRKL